MNAKHPIRNDLRVLVPQYPSNFYHKKAAFTLAEGATHVAHWKDSRKVAFTLAEVLITLGIIGVVAALTLPNLIENHNRKVVETRLEKVYSTMNQAIRMAELDYGDRENWFVDYADKDEQKAWIKKYILPYIKYNKFDEIKISGMYMNAIYFTDGSALVKISTNGRDWTFFSGNIEKCIKTPTASYKNYIGKCAFAYYYNPVSVTNSSKSFNSYGTGWTSYGNNPEEAFKYHASWGCYNQESTWRGFCTALIHRNGWKFPKDYPYRVHY